MVASQPGSHEQEKAPQYVTEAPIEAPTAAEEPTKQPATEVPTEAPQYATEQPTVQPATEAPAEMQPTEGAPAETRAALVLSSIGCERALVPLGEAIRWSFDAENADALRYEITNRAGEIVAAGEASEKAISYQPSACGKYTVMVYARQGDEEIFSQAAVCVINGDCVARLTTGQRYAVAEKSALQYALAFRGGAAPYQVSWSVQLGGDTAYEAAFSSDNEGSAVLEYMPAQFGVYTIHVKVVDQAGQISEASASMPVAVNEKETATQWQQSVAGAGLTGDWRDDLVAIARTQIGYGESDRNFIIDENGARRGWTRYGEWYGAPHAD